MNVALLLVAGAVAYGDVPEKLWSVHPTGTRCFELPDTPYEVDNWVPDPNNTVRDQGIFAFYNPDEPRQLALFFKTRTKCEELLRRMIERQGPLASQAPPGNNKQTNVNEAVLTLGNIFSARRLTLWCGCDFSESGAVRGDNCGYTSPGASPLIQWIPVVEPEHFGAAGWKGHDRCVDESGKSFKGDACAELVDPDFPRMRADMYNLIPVIDGLAAKTRGKTLGEVDGEPRHYGKCDVEVKEATFEPPTTIRGDIARTFQYMEMAYPKRGILNPARRKLFAVWAALDPVDRWECDRTKSIAEAQGNENLIVATACELAGLH